MSLEAPPPAPAPAPAPPQQDSRAIKKAARNILETQDEVWGILRENSRLIEQFTSLAAAAGPLDNTDHLIQQVTHGCTRISRRDNFKMGCFFRRLICST